MDRLSKIKSCGELATLLRSLRAGGKVVVFTNGCFDLLHAGHVRYLAEARREGDILVVGLNSDRSVRDIKGDTRPILRESERAEVLAGLAAVNYIVLFDEPDPLRLITALAPDVLVKGGDWPEEAIIGAQVVRNRGGRVVRIPVLEGASTSAIIARILERYRD